MRRAMIVQPDGTDYQCEEKCIVTSHLSQACNALIFCSFIALYRLYKCYNPLEQPLQCTKVLFKPWSFIALCSLYKCYKPLEQPFFFITLQTLFGFYHIPLKRMAYVTFHQIVFACIALVLSGAHISSVVAAIKLVNQGCVLICVTLYYSLYYSTALYYRTALYYIALQCITMASSLFIRANSNADNLVVVAERLTNSLTRAKVEGWSYWTESPQDAQIINARLL